MVRVKRSLPVRLSRVNADGAVTSLRMPALASVVCSAAALAACPENRQPVLVKTHAGEVSRIRGKSSHLIQPPIIE